jgi:hypothetical protein
MTSPMPEPYDNPYADDPADDTDPNAPWHYMDYDGGELPHGMWMGIAAGVGFLLGSGVTAVLGTVIYRGICP